MKLAEYGWDELREREFFIRRDDGCRPARVIAAEVERYRLVTENGELRGEVSGRFRHGASDRAAFPVVGDWVSIRPRLEERRATIDDVLERRGSFSRKLPGVDAAEQVVAANLDWVILVMGLDRDFNLRRAERYLATIRAGGARPVIVLNKADLCLSPDRSVTQVEGVADDVPVHAVSAIRGDGLDALRARLMAGQTAAFIGSSGAGKSTLANRFLSAPALAVGEVRASDGRGRHTTTRRELFLLPGGGMVIDTPGLREIQPWDFSDAGGEFGEIERIAAGCRFRDCRHQREPGCAVHRALGEGSLEAARFENFLKLKREASHLEARKRRHLRLLGRRRGLQWRLQKGEGSDPV